MKFVIAGYTVDFPLISVIRVSLVLCIVALAFLLVFLLLGEDAQRNIKKWLGLGFWGTIGALLATMLIGLVIGIIMALLFLV